MAYSCEELQELLEKVLPFVEKKLIAKNCDGHLNEYLELIGFPLPGRVQSSYYCEPRNARLLIIGDLAISKRTIDKILKNNELKATNVDYVEYESTTNFDFARLEGSSKYSDIFFGPTPHSASGADGYSSIITKLIAQQDKYPKVHVLSDSNSLKITKTSFVKALEESDFYKGMLMNI